MNGDCRITLDNAHVTLGGVPILRGVSLIIASGECIRIAGGNGSGKTTLLRLLNGEIHPDGGISPSREYCVDGETSFSPIIARRFVRFVSPGLHDRYRQKGWNLDGREVIATGIDDTPLLYRNLTENENADVDELAGWLGIEQLLKKSILSMSRGEGRKILIARALAGNPKILLLDELLHELDPGARSEITALIERCCERGAGVVFTTHREDELVRQLSSTRYLVDGELLNETPAAKISDRFIHKKEKEPVRQHETIFSLSRCNVFLSGSPVLKEIDIDIDSRNWAVIGGNGSGKSTLLRLLYGDLRPALGGNIKRFGVSGDESLDLVRPRIGYLSSEFQARYDRDCSGIDVVVSGLRGTVGIYETLTDNERAAAVKMLERFHLGYLSDRQFGVMSYGEQRRIMFARALVSQPKILLLDEPFAGVDARSREELILLTGELSDSGMSIIIAVHHPEDIPSSVKGIIHLEKGRLVYCGSIDNFPVAEYLKGI
jgi:molybdate transport system ATP-binding protein